MRLLLLGIIGLLVATALVPSYAVARDRADYIEIVPPEAAGCYFIRGERYCGRYCYWEINGKRYCQPRARDAWPQAEFYLEDDTPPPRRRHRSMK